MTWIFLSPHFDDIALSCGGLAWEQAHSRQLVQVWTICAGEVPAGPLSPFAQSLHARWETDHNAPVARRDEDIAACRAMRALPRHFLLPDCIYRTHPKTGTHLYASEEAIFGPIDVAENDLVTWLADELLSMIPEDAVVVCPLTLGGHVDHRLVRAAVEKTYRPVWYYADYPYVLEEAYKLETLRRSGWQYTDFPISEAGLNAWTESVAAHQSQVSTFWPDTASMQAAMRSYRETYSGCVRLWRPGSNAD